MHGMPWCGFLWVLATEFWFMAFIKLRKFTENCQSIAYHCFEYRINKTITFSLTSLSWCSGVSISLLIFEKNQSKAFSREEHQSQVG